MVNNVGTVTYNSGNVGLTTFKPTTITDGTSNVSVTVTLDSNDITPLREQILLISNNDISITMIDTGGTGQTTRNKYYNFYNITETTSTSSSDY